MGKNVVWRGWWYLAIERYPALVAIFPNFIQYVLLVALIGIPLLVLVGYAHWKKTSARRAEVDIFYEVNPYVIRQLVNTEMVVQMNLTLNQHILKLSQGQKLSDEEINDLSQLQEKLSEFTKKRKFRSKDDMKFFNNIDTHFKK